MINTNKFVPLRYVNLDTLIKDKTIYTGGHFVLVGQRAKCLNEGTLVSFQYAVDMYIDGLEQGLDVGLGILVNNIGQTCNQSVCTIKTAVNKQDFKFPKKYLEILDENNIPIKDVIIFWEKHIRNRGKKELMKRVAKQYNINKQEKDYWLMDNGIYGKIILSRGNSKDKYGTPACPLIMGALFIEQEKMGYNKSINFYYIGNDNQDNIPNHFVIEKGKVVARKFGSELEAQNIFLMQKR